MVEMTRSPRAVADLDEIWFHVARHDPVAADRPIDRIVARCAQLERHPELGPARPDIAPDTRVLTAGDYLILYRVREGGVDIVRIVHGARRLRNLLDL